MVTFAFTSEEKESLVKTLQNLEGGNGQLWQDHQVNNEAIAVQWMAEWGCKVFQRLLV